MGRIRWLVLDLEGLPAGLVEGPTDRSNALRLAWSQYGGRANAVTSIAEVEVQAEERAIIRRELRQRRPCRAATEGLTDG